MARREKGCAVALAGATVALAALIWQPVAARAAEAGAGAVLPRFGSLRADKVNLRTGPGGNYPIDWVLTRKDMPVEILAVWEHWRKIRDWEGTSGWVHEKMVWGRRQAIVKGGVRAMHKGPDPAAPIVARAEPGVLGRLLECRGNWCRIDAGEVSGWVRRGDIWGVHPDESVP